MIYMLALAILAYIALNYIAFCLMAICEGDGVGKGIGIAGLVLFGAVTLWVLL